MKFFEVSLVFCALLLFVGIDGRPLDENDVSNQNEPNVALIGMTIVLGVCLVMVVAICACCGEEFIGGKGGNARRVVVRDESLEPPGDIPSTPTSVHRPFDPQESMPVSIEPLPDVSQLRGKQNSQPKPLGFNHAINRGISCQEWFKGNAIATPEFPRSQLQYMKPLAEEAWFGQVVEGVGRLSADSPKKKLAVKILRDDVTTMERAYFFHEAELYRDLNHPNILQLFAKCTESEPCLLIYELYAQDLKSFLLKSRGKFDELSKNGQLLQICCQVADGLSFAHERGFVINDLACRNCLIAENGNVKLGDYGISPQKFKDDYHISGDIAIPLRWLPPEMIEKTTDGRILTKEVQKTTNVWTFAVVLWEILELGKTPYMELKTEEVVDKVMKSEGIRLAQPNTPVQHSAQLYEMMKRCWNDTPNQRPSMAQIHKMLQYVYDQRNALPDFDAKWESSFRNEAGVTDVTPLNQEQQTTSPIPADPLIVSNVDPLLHIQPTPVTNQSIIGHGASQTPSAPIPVILEDPIPRPVEVEKVAPLPPAVPRPVVEVEVEPVPQPIPAKRESLANNTNAQQQDASNVPPPEGNKKTEEELSREAAELERFKDIENERNEKRKFVFSLSDSELVNMDSEDLVQFYEFLSMDEIRDLENKHSELKKKLEREKKEEEDRRRADALRSKYHLLIQNGTTEQLSSLNAKDLEEASDVLSEEDLGQLQIAIDRAMTRIKLLNEAGELERGPATRLAAVSEDSIREYMKEMTHKDAEKLEIKWKQAREEEEERLRKEKAEQEALELEKMKIEEVMMNQDLQDKETGAEMTTDQAKEMATEDELPASPPPLDSYKERKKSLKDRRKASQSLEPLAAPGEENLLMPPMGDDDTFSGQSPAETKVEFDEGRNKILNITDDELMKLPMVEIESFYKFLTPEEIIEMKEKLFNLQETQSRLAEAAEIKRAELLGATRQELNDIEPIELEKFLRTMPPEDAEQIRKKMEPELSVISG